MLALLLLATLTPVDLRTHLDASPPQLSWKLEGGVRQTAYRIIANAGAAELWDSGRVVSAETLRIPYAGKPLVSSQAVQWKVQVWDENNAASAWSRPAAFNTSILRASDWRAVWIGPGVGAPLANALPILRREFQVTKPVRQALVHVTGLGQFELRLNGQKVGDNVMDPGWTHYRKTVLYVTHDVTALLKPGANAMGALLGNGIYNVPGGRYAKFTGSFGPVKLLAQLHIEYEDGSTMLVPTDSNWRFTAGPIVFSCFFGGEDFDARREPAGWDRPGFDDSSWTRARPMDGPGGELRPQTHPPSRVHQTFNGTLRPGTRVYDLGQNFAGWPVIRVRGEAGQKIRLIPGELLDAKGQVTQRSSGGPMWFEYTLRGGGEEVWRPRFTYYGFRYVQAEGDTPASLAVSGEFLYSSAGKVGEFECSKPLFNRIHALILAALRSNLQSVLTDCPHREKLGWLEVAHLMGPSLFYNHDASTLYAKIAADTRESQLDSGLVPSVSPEYVTFRGGFRDSAEWGSAAVIIPSQLLQWYGDSSTLRAQYDTIRRYTGYLSTQLENGVLTRGLGDWYDIGPKPPGASQLTPLGLTATAFYLQNLQIASAAAALAGRTEDTAGYSSQALSAAISYQQRFGDVSSQTGLAMALEFNLAAPYRRAKMIETLVNDIRARGNHVSAGDVGFRFVVQALQNAGRSDVLFDVAANEEAPSYGAQLKAGATALTEAWDANQNSSHNHCMLGHLEEWFYSGLAGIQPVPGELAFRMFRLRPQVVGDLEWVRASFNSPRGLIKSQWRRTGNQVEFEFTIPPNTTAAVTIPGQLERNYGPGVHKLTGAL